MPLPENRVAEPLLYGTAREPLPDEEDILVYSLQSLQAYADEQASYKYPIRAPKEG